LGLTLAVLCFGWAVASSGASPAGRAFFWLTLLTEETWGWTRWKNKKGSGVFLAGPDSADRPASPGRRWLGFWGKEPPAASPLKKRLPTPFPDEGEVLQHLTRRRSAEGDEELSGWVRMPVAVGQRNGHVHVAFCPPFARTPEWVVHQADGPEARIKTAQLFPYGVRLDLKLSAAAVQPDGVLLSFSAKLPGGTGPRQTGPVESDGRE
jgi:hypothetical protein